ncbi:hypothetical protein J8O29_003316 [Salmonella enterica]|uniref:Uncharacterized protein n=10 Tax=Salmonella enterica TaxID=28901 RepID=A0A5T4CUZ8_SALET|nr:hypothetical protein [Salmonella enterica]YP_007010999.1 hypothetical protein F482_gp29 [Salmonella phage SPN3UB]EAA4243825.1 hypothetical protein [Salmonella enterica subsp. enterica serovar Bareilly]EAA7680004.1 hypothetical protein [Salmonella enterica subsp. houtenae]EAA8712789.1 hypothetical protein [Salmonella enterica subsp. enterica serovar Derby]EAB9336148.1 hypothetical protein [Salmonella enterica subsp. enterica serovar Kiambu]EAC0288150.1 hypothetical protein [Salmonella enter
MKKNFRLQMECNAKTIDELNKEVGQLKCVVGFLMAQLPPERREAIINNLKEYELNDSANEFNQFL